MSDPDFDLEAFDVCDECGGDGGWGIPRFCPREGYYEDWRKCECCKGYGFVWRAIEPAGEERIIEQLDFSGHLMDYNYQW